MVWAKNIIVKVIDSKTGNDFVKTQHYSGKVVPNSQLHFGVFLNWILGGVMQYWPSTDKSKLIWLVEGTGRNEFIELNRMAFSGLLPKNSESRALAISFKLIKKNAPHIKRIVSFADGCQCGDGTIYRASGFELTRIKINTSLRIDEYWNPRSEITFSAHRPNEMAKFRAMKKIDWFMLRYIKHLQEPIKRNYEIIPYSKIKEMGAGMYKGVKKE
mgnify:FL=1